MLSGMYFNKITALCWNWFDASDVASLIKVQFFIVLFYTAIHYSLYYICDISRNAKMSMNTNHSPNSVNVC